MSLPVKTDGKRHQRSLKQRAKISIGSTPGQGRIRSGAIKGCPPVVAQLVSQHPGVGPGDPLGGHHLRQTVTPGETESDIAATVQIDSTAKPIHQKMQRINTCFHHGWYQPLAGG
jgi:hypothetical protein